MVLRCAAQQEAMYCHSSQHWCSWTPASSLTVGLWGRCVSPVSSSKAAALEKQQHAFARKHCIMHSPFSSFSVPFFFSHPWPLLPTDPQSPTPTHRLTTGLTLPWSFSFWLSTSAMVRKHKVHLSTLDWKGGIKLISPLICGCLSAWLVPLGIWEWPARKQP